MKVLVTGAGGQLGTHLMTLLGASGVGLTRSMLDIASAASVAQALDEHAPDVVINAAAYTAVDDAETAIADASSVNAVAPGVLATAAATRGVRLVHVSTDYVFEGSAARPYEPDDPTGPRTAYGRTKLLGEQAVLSALPTAWVVRSAWIYGGPGPNFVDTMRRLERERDTLDVVDDQIGSPTWARDLAAALLALGSSDAAPGVLHYANAGSASWFDLAQAVFELTGADPQRVRPTTSDKFVRPAPRPAWSVLSTQSWTSRGLPAPRPWREALEAALAC